jgi:hypothetical protein
VAAAHDYSKKKERGRATVKNVTANFAFRGIYIPATEPWSRLTLREECDFCS